MVNDDGKECPCTMHNMHTTDNGPCITCTSKFQEAGDSGVDNYKENPDAQNTGAAGTDSDEESFRLINTSDSDVIPASTVPSVCNATQNVCEPKLMYRSQGENYETKCLQMSTTNPQKQLLQIPVVKERNIKGICEYCQTYNKARGATCRRCEDVRSKILYSKLKTAGLIETTKSHVLLQRKLSYIKPAEKIKGDSLYLSVIKRQRDKTKPKITPLLPLMEFDEISSVESPVKKTTIKEPCEIIPKHQYGSRFDENSDIDLKNKEGRGMEQFEIEKNESGEQIPEEALFEIEPIEQRKLEKKPTDEEKQQVRERRKSSTDFDKLDKMKTGQKRESMQSHFSISSLLDSVSEAPKDFKYFFPKKVKKKLVEGNIEDRSSSQLFKDTIDRLQTEAEEKKKKDEEIKKLRTEEKELKRQARINEEKKAEEQKRLHSPVHVSYISSDASFPKGKHAKRWTLGSDSTNSEDSLRKRKGRRKDELHESEEDVGTKKQKKVKGDYEQDKERKDLNEKKSEKEREGKYDKEKDGRYDREKVQSGKEKGKSGKERGGKSDAEREGKYDREKALPGKEKEGKPSKDTGRKSDKERVLPRPGREMDGKPSKENEVKIDKEKEKVDKEKSLPAHGKNREGKPGKKTESKSDKDKEKADKERPLPASGKDREGKPGKDREGKSDKEREGKSDKEMLLQPPGRERGGKPGKDREGKSDKEREGKSEKEKVLPAPRREIEEKPGKESKMKPDKEKEKVDKEKSLPVPGKERDATPGEEKGRKSDMEKEKPGKEKLLLVPGKERDVKPAKDTEEKSDKETEGKSDKGKVLPAPGKDREGKPDKDKEGKSDKEKILPAPRSKRGEKSGEESEVKPDKEKKKVDNEKALPIPGEERDAIHGKGKGVKSDMEKEKLGKEKLLLVPEKERDGKPGKDKEGKSDKETEGKSDKGKVLPAPGKEREGKLSKESEAKTDKDKDEALPAPGKDRDGKPGKNRERKSYKDREGKSEKDGEGKSDKERKGKSDKAEILPTPRREGTEKPDKESDAKPAKEKHIADKEKVLPVPGKERDTKPGKEREGKSDLRDLIDKNKIKGKESLDNLIYKKISEKGEITHHGRDLIPPLPVIKPKLSSKRQRNQTPTDLDESESDLDRPSRRKREIAEENDEIVYTDQIIKRHQIPISVEVVNEKNVNDAFISAFKEELLTEMPTIPEIPASSELAKKKEQQEAYPSGVIRYALSDPTFIEKGWTLLPIEKVMRKTNVYRMHPAHPEFDWFEHNKKKGGLRYDSGEKLAEFDENGRGKWFYKNGRLALDYYNAEEINAQQRIVVYSNGEPDERGRSRPITVLGMFDYSGNGVVFDHKGKVRLKYNQTEGVLLDREIGPASHWKWHSLNDPPELQRVMIETRMPYQDPQIVNLGKGFETPPSKDDENMLSIEFENFIKEKSQKINTEKFKPFQIKMKALKINENFSLRILDQASVYLLFRYGKTNLKLNLGMVLDSQEIVDTNIAEAGQVANKLEEYSARTDSLTGLQHNIAYAQVFERNRMNRDQRLRPPQPIYSADKFNNLVSKPLKSPLTAAYSKCKFRSRKPPTCTMYYNSRLN